MPKPWGEYLGTVIAQLLRHPEVDLHGEDDERGKIVDAVAIDLNGGTVEGPWGRKARRGDGSHKNGDGLTYRRADGRFEIVDILLGPDEPLSNRGDYAAWQPKGDFAPGENGWWAPPLPVAPPPPALPPMEALRDYFYDLIVHRIGEPADDYQSRLRHLADVGMPVNARPGERPDFSKFKGIRLVIDNNGRGNPRGTLQLPTDTPDALGYFTHEVAIIRDRAAGQPPFVGPFDYDWIDRGGPPVVYVGAPTVPGGGGGGEPGNGGEALQQALRALREEFHGVLAGVEVRHTEQVARLDRDKGELLERIGQLEAKVRRMRVKGPTTGRRLVPFGPTHFHDVDLQLVDPEEA